MFKLTVEAILWDDASRAFREPVQDGLRRQLTVGYVVREDEVSVALAHEIRPILNYLENDSDYTTIPKSNIVQRVRVGSTTVTTAGLIREGRKRGKVLTADAARPSASSQDGFATGANAGADT